MVQVRVQPLMEMSRLAAQCTASDGKMEQLSQCTASDGNGAA